MSVADVALKPVPTSPAPVKQPAGRVSGITRSSNIEHVLETVRDKVPPLWPLKDSVAINPYAGYADLGLLEARTALQNVCEQETLAPLEYYRSAFAKGMFCREDIEAALSELEQMEFAGLKQVDADSILEVLEKPSDTTGQAVELAGEASGATRVFRSAAELLDHSEGTDWSRTIRDEIARHCAGHYDQGQALWKQSWKTLPLYESWWHAAQYDRTFEILGVRGFRAFVGQLLQDPHQALVSLLERVEVPASLWEAYLLCEAMTMPGWSGWTRYQQRAAEVRGEGSTDMAGLLAIRLAYVVGLLEATGFTADWDSMVAWDRETLLESAGLDSPGPDRDAVTRFVLLRATEMAFRNQLIGRLSETVSSDRPHDASRRPHAQMVFCIDVRSERIRRQLEAAADVETFGFAGFFGVPMEFVELGASTGSAQVPVLLSPQFKVHEQIDGSEPQTLSRAIAGRRSKRFLRKSWKDFQASAVGCFSFVETTGLFYGFKLLSRTMGWGKTSNGRSDGISSVNRARLAPSLTCDGRDLLPLTAQVDLAESILRGIGILDKFARLVVFCGHGSQAENNPLQAGLDCGACGGHSGEPNARFAARLLNSVPVREALVQRGILVPEDTVFVAALHNTTTDQIEFFDPQLLPESHQSELEDIESLSSCVARQTRYERMSQLPGPDETDLVRRSKDWSEVRPEWGLAGNAAFIAAPRSLTGSCSLEGRAFLHSYDHQNDPEFKVLEQIMTAPLVVAHLINMQYYASTVDPIHSGSGTKTVHNVVGQFGIFSGNGGDLMPGLAWQSLHDGTAYQHHPLRLQALIAAPRKAIDEIVSKHKNLRDLITNAWLHLIAVDERQYYRYTQQQEWEPLLSEKQQLANYS